MIKNLKLSFLLILIIFLGFSCTKKTTNEDNAPILKKTYEPNAEKRARASVDSKGSILFGGGKKRESTFASTNVMWRATLKSLDFMPLATVDYAGGIIVTDWYYKNNSNEQLKISVNFLAKEIASTSIKVKSYKKVCTGNNCKVSQPNEQFNNSIRDKIFVTIRKLNIEQESKK
jgi:hypothetical protein